MTVGPIPWSTVDRFIASRVARGAIDGIEARALETLIPEIDGHEAEHRFNKKKPKEAEPDD